MRTILLSCMIIAGAGAFAPADDKSGPPVTIVLGARHAHATPLRQGFAHTGGGNIDVVQPAPDTVIVTMTGIAVAGAHPCKDSVAALTFDLDQCFEVRCEDEKLTRARLMLDARVIGLLRSHKLGSAEQSPGCATINAGPAALVTVCAPPHAVGGGENLSVNCHEGPARVSVGAGSYTLHESWCVRATHPRSLRPCKAASAEFAPEPALDPLWISYWEPFHGAAKNNFGFQLVLKTVPEANGK